jgi:regulator of sigma E protease
MFLTIITFLVVLSILVLFHEFGHFIVAKKSGIKVEEFGLGLPPRIWGKKIGETIYSLNALPIGGFVKLEGDEISEAEKKSGLHEHAFFAKSKKVRAAVIVAGVTMNIILAVLAFSFVYTKTGIPTETNKVKIIGLAPNSPAEAAGLKVDDYIFKVNGTEITSTDSFIGTTKELSDQPIKLEIIREKDNPCTAQILGAIPGIEMFCTGDRLVLTVTPRANPPAGEGPLGVVISSIEPMFYPLWQMIPKSIVEGFKEAFSWLSLIIFQLGGMIGQLFRGQVPQDVAGPVGILQVTGTVMKAGWLSVIQFMGILSVNLAVMNILPLPALDGGRLLFIVVEAITRKKPSADFENRVHSIGMALLLLLFLLVTINDVSRIVSTSGILDQIKSFLRF